MIPTADHKDTAHLHIYLLIFQLWKNSDRKAILLKYLFNKTKPTYSRMEYYNKSNKKTQLKEKVNLTSNQ